MYKIFCKRIVKRLVKRIVKHIKYMSTYYDRSIDVVLE